MSEQSCGSVGDGSGARAWCAPLLADVAAFLSQFVDQESYGHFPGGDPRLFRPDPECSTEREREAHREACAAWERGEQTDAGPACGTIRALLGRDEEPAPVGFGLGVYTYSDDDVAALLQRVREAMDARRAPPSRIPEIARAAVLLFGTGNPGRAVALAQTALQGDLGRSLSDGEIEAVAAAVAGELGR